MCKIWNDEVYLAAECEERFLVASDIAEMKQYDIFMAGLAHLKEGYRVERSRPDIHTVLVTLEGAGVLSTDEGVFDILPNTITVLPSEKPFCFELAYPRKSWKMVWLLLHSSDTWTNLLRINRPVIHFDACESIWSLTSLIYREIGGRSAFRNMMLSELAKVLSSVTANISDTHMRVLSVLNSVESQLHLDWKVSTIAELTFLSEEQLNRVVKQLVGMSPRDYLLTLRMKKATDLLSHKDWSIAMIALRLGYKDPNNFTHRFKKHFGKPPTHYRASLLPSKLT